MTNKRLIEKAVQVMSIDYDVKTNTMSCTVIGTGEKMSTCRQCDAKGWYAIRYADGYTAACDCAACNGRGWISALKAQVCPACGDRRITSRRDADGNAYEVCETCEKIAELSKGSF